MTWNLWWRFGGRWRERQRAIAATLRTVQPDVVGLQEVWRTADTNQAELLADELGMHSAFAAPSLPPPPDPPESPDQAGVDLGVAVLSRWPILEARQHQLPTVARTEVVALAAAVEHPAGRLHVLTCCLEWELGRKAERLAQARAVAELVSHSSRDGRLPVLLAADLNAPPPTPEVEALTGFMVDAWTAADSSDPGHTLSASNPLAPKEAWQLDQRIDYVLARPGRSGQPLVVERAFVSRDPHGGVQPSDHFAVVADFRL